MEILYNTSLPVFYKKSNSLLNINHDIIEYCSSKDIIYPELDAVQLDILPNDNNSISYFEVLILSTGKSG